MLATAARYGSVLRAQNKATQEIVAIKKFKRKFYTWEEYMALQIVHHEMVTIKARPAGAVPRGGFGHGYTRHVPKPVKGRAAYKKWTGSAICQAAFAPPEQPGKTASKAEGAAKGTRVAAASSLTT